MYKFVFVLKEGEGGRGMLTTGEKDQERQGGQGDERKAA
jgi:hypothetical protein